MKLFTQPRPDKNTAFRLPKMVLATVDKFCSQQDLTRSQLYRRSILEFLKNQQVDILEMAPPELRRTWSDHLYKRIGQ